MDRHVHLTVGDLDSQHRRFVGRRRPRHATGIQQADAVDDLVKQFVRVARDADRRPAAAVFGDDAGDPLFVVPPGPRPVGDDELDATQRDGLDRRQTE